MGRNLHRNNNHKCGFLSPKTGINGYKLAKAYTQYRQCMKQENKKHTPLYQIKPSLFSRWQVFLHVCTGNSLQMNCIMRRKASGALYTQLLLQVQALVSQVF
jgi:hypothetical protein